MLIQLDQVPSRAQAVSLKVMRFVQPDPEDVVAPHMGQGVEICEHGVRVEHEPVLGAVLVLPYPEEDAGLEQFLEDHPGRAGESSPNYLDYVC